METDIQQGAGAFDFPEDRPPGSQEETIIRRTFMLSHDDFPDVLPRKIVQLQYIGWPDQNVPDSPIQLLNLVKEVNALRQEYRASGTGSRRKTRRRAGGSSTIKEIETAPGPVLVHCSAGVGRTGSFVVVDAVLDAIRRETKNKLTKAANAQKGSGGGYSTSVSMGSLGSVESPSLSRQVSDDDPGIIRLDASGHEVLSSDSRSVKKRRSSGGAHSSGGMSALGELRLAGKASSTSLSSLKQASPSTSSLLEVSRRPQSRDISPMSPIPQRFATPQPVPASATGNSAPNSGSSSGVSFRLDSASPRAQLVASPSGMQELEEKRAPPVVTSSHLHHQHLNSSSSVSGSVSTSSSQNPSNSSVSTASTSVSMDWDRDSMNTSSTLPSSADERMTTFELKKSSLPLKKSGLSSAPFPDPQSPSKVTPVASSRSSRPSPAPNSSRMSGIQTTDPFADLELDRQRQAPMSRMPMSFHRIRQQDSDSLSALAMSRSPSPPLSGATTSIGPGSVIPPISDFKNTRRHAERHPASTSSSAYDYTAPRKIRLPREIRSYLDVKDASFSSGPSAPITIPGQEQTSSDILSSISSDSSTPSPLSEIDEPIRQVLEDMRLQRMSLCQSLRQYVFVHLAIIEGSLAILDEVKAELAASGDSEHSDHNNMFEARTRRTSSVKPDLSVSLTTGHI